MTRRPPLALAPMAGVTDHAFRRLCHAFGCDYSVTEMISAKALHYRDEKTAILARIRADEGPVAVQIFGSEPDIMAEAAAKLTDGSYDGCLSDAPPIAIDVNMGCPMKKIVSNGEGSALLKDPERIYAIVSAMAAATDLPITVKLRVGWDSAHRNAPECALAAVSGGARAITVHGRTREQLYAPPIDLETIAAVKRAVGTVPVIANGGITDVRSAAEMLRITGCDGLMIGQASMGRPWIFTELADLSARLPEGSSALRKLFRLPIPPNAIDGCDRIDGCDPETAGLPPLGIPTDAAAVMAIAKLHLRLIADDKGETTAVREGRHHLAWYARGLRGGAKFREEINHLTGLAEVFDAIDRLTYPIHL